LFGARRDSVTVERDAQPMQNALMRRTWPEPLAFTRTGSRAARVGAFALETWSRLLVDGPSTPPDERARELAWVAENMCALHGVRMTVRGRAPSAPALLVANHMSYFDPMIIASLMPCTVVAKCEVGDWPCIGDVCRRLGVLYVERENAHSGARVVREILRSFDRGVSVLVFPEGTTTTGRSVLPFKRGSFGAAALSGVPIVPVALRYECKDLAWVGNATFLPHYVRTMSKPYTRVSVEFLPQLPHGDVRSAAELAQRARAAISSAIAYEHRRHDLPMSRLGDGWAATA
jgi:lyso-ornithine lipid O-acyltransferase